MRFRPLLSGAVLAALLAAGCGRENPALIQSGTLVHVNGRTGKVVGTVRVQGSPDGIAVEGRSIWFAVREAA